MLIREARSGDVPAIQGLMNDAITNTTTNYNYKEYTGESVLNWLHKKRVDKKPVFVYELNHKVVAYSSFDVFRGCDAYQYSVEHSVYVHADFQGRGIGKMLLTALIERAQKEGYHTMIAGIDASNQQSYDFHKKLGFREAGRVREVGFKFDRWLDLIFMQLMLDH